MHNIFIDNKSYTAGWCDPGTEKIRLIHGDNNQSKKFLNLIFQTFSVLSENGWHSKHKA